MAQTLEDTDDQDRPPHARVPAGIAVQPDAEEVVSDAPHGDAMKIIESIEKRAPTADAARVLVEHLFAQPSYRIPGIDYAVGYKLAEGLTGGDIVDVYLFDNGNTAFSIADIAGKGVRAAVHAAMIKYGLRAYASEGLTAEKVLRSLDRLFLENNAFEQTEAFASVFIGILDTTRRMLTYASGAHEPAVLLRPGEPALVLEITAPLIGVFEDQHHLFKQAFIEVPEGSLFVAATDGFTEARRGNDMLGIEGLVGLAEFHRDEDVDTIARMLLAEAEVFSGNVRDDIAVLVARIH